jgi:Tfp pilus assembly protein PilF
VVIELLQAELYDLEGRTSDVEKAYRTILERKDLTGAQMAIVANNLAFHLARPETIAEAKQLIDKALVELGPHPDLLDTRGIIHLAAGETKPALIDLEEAALDPSPAKLLHLATAQVANQQLAQARQSLDRAKKLGLVPEQLSAADKGRYDLVEAALAAGPGA